MNDYPSSDCSNNDIGVDLDSILSQQNLQKQNLIAYFFLESPHLKEGVW